MQITEFITILLFIFPGILSEKIRQMISIPKNDKKESEFASIIYGIGLGLPINITVLLILYLLSGYKTFDDLKLQFSNINFTLLYVLLIFIISVVSGILIGFLAKPVEKFKNFIREKVLNIIKISDGDCWRRMFFDNKDEKYLKININGNVCKGLSKHYSISGEEKEIILHIPEEWSSYPGIEDKFSKIKNVYVNFEKNIIIEDYDVSDYIKYCNELRHPN